MKMLRLSFLLPLLWLASPAVAQNAMVIASCGSPTQTYPAGVARPLTQDTTGKACVNATVSASVTGFTPATTGTPISVTTGGVTGTLPVGAVVVASNVGTTNTAYCKLGASATTSDQPVTPNGGWFAFTVGAATQLTCITSASTTTVNMVGGSGLPTGTGGGGGGSGGSVTQGTSPWVVSNGGTFATQAAQSGTWNVTNISGTVSLPTGAATAANQSTEITALNSIVTNTGAAIPAGSAVIGQVGIDQTTFGTTNGVVSAASRYQAVAASQTATVLQSSTGATGDYLSHCIIYPASTSPGVVTVFDSTNTAANSAVLFAGGTSSTSNLTPIPVPVGAKSLNGAWKVTTGANVSVVCVGKFS